MERDEEANTGGLPGGDVEVWQGNWIFFGRLVSLRRGTLLSAVSM